MQRLDSWSGVLPLHKGGVMQKAEFLSHRIYKVAVPWSCLITEEDMYYHGPPCLATPLANKGPTSKVLLIKDYDSYHQ